MTASKWMLVLALAGCQQSTSNLEKPAGKLEPIDAPKADDVAPVIAAEVTRANADHKHLVVYLGATWCEPCVKFHAAAARGELDDEFGDVRMLVFDADRDNEALQRAGYKYELVPLFALPGPDGKSLGKQIEGSIKGASYVQQISPRLRALVDGVKSVDIEARLHRAKQIEAELVQIALEATGAETGALFVWDKEANGLALVHHVVGGLTVTLPRVVKKGETAGIALHVYETDKPYLAPDTSRDPLYTRYLMDVGSIAAAPIGYQKRAIGVLTVSSREPGLPASTLERIAEIADVAAPLLRRAQIDKLSRAATGRPLMIKGLSPQWHEVERKIELAAPTNAPILVRGESGTGKDLVARAIHWNSRRAEKPYVTVNCAAIPETLLESILFGHVKGAFTGASFHKVGEFQKADGGTLFLDEVGELPVMLQAKVLRAVEQGEVQPLGSNEPPDRVDVRLICATNRDLEAMAKTGAFRDDLFYRLSVMTLDLPPLRSYKDNLEVIANVFLETSAAAHGKRAPRLGPDVLSRLVAYDFPGNVRELKNTIEHAVILATGDELRSEDLPRPLLDGASRRSVPVIPTQPTLEEAREKWLDPLERQYLTELLAKHAGNVEQAARSAGINKVTMYRLLKRRGLQIGRTVR